MTDGFTLTVPADGRYRELGVLVAAKYAEIAGATAADVQALAAAVTDAVNGIAPKADPAAEIHLAFALRGGHVEITARCGSHSTIVKRPLAAHHH